MKKASLIIKIVICLLCLVTIVTVLAMHLSVHVPNGSMRTEKDLHRIIVFIVVSSILLLLVVAFGVILLVENKKRNDVLYRMADGTDDRSDVDA